MPKVAVIGGSFPISHVRTLTGEAHCGLKWYIFGTSIFAGHDDATEILLLYILLLRFNPFHAAIPAVRLGGWQSRDSGDLDTFQRP